MSQVLVPLYKFTNQYKCACTLSYSLTITILFYYFLYSETVTCMQVWKWGRSVVTLFVLVFCCFAILSCCFHLYCFMVFCQRTIQWWTSKTN